MVDGQRFSLISLAILVNVVALSFHESHQGKAWQTECKCTPRHRQHTSLKMHLKTHEVFLNGGSTCYVSHTLLFRHAYKFLEVYLYKYYMLCELYFVIQTCIQISRSVSVQVLRVSVCDGILILLTVCCFITLIFLWFCWLTRSVRISLKLSNITACRCIRSVSGNRAVKYMSLQGICS